MKEAAVTSLYLASQSPRRAELLRQIGLDFAVLAVDVDEALAAGEDPGDFARRLALDKARAGWCTLATGTQRPVLGADTIVIAGERVLGKPAGRQEGIDMLQALSGRTHEVITAVAVATDRQAARVQRSRVTFRTLTRTECQAYWDTGEPRDKAGAYAIQGLAATFISRLEGSYSGVMGLPLYETTELLKTFGITTPGACRI